MDWKLVLQIAGVVLGLLYLWLEYRADIRLWIVGLIMPLVHGALYYKAGLYADCSMQAYYVLAGLYGWIVWHNAPRRKAAADRIGHTPLRQAAGLIAVYTAAHTGIYFLLVGFTNSTVPFWDAMTTAGSIVAMWMLSRKYVEQWLVWLAVDLVTVGLYLYKGIPLTAGLYALYSALAVAGYLRWKAKNARIAIRPQNDGRPSPAAGTAFVFEYPGRCAGCLFHIGEVDIAELQGTAFALERNVARAIRTRTFVLQHAVDIDGHPVALADDLGLVPLACRLLAAGIADPCLYRKFPHRFDPGGPCTPEQHQVARTPGHELAFDPLGPDLVALLHALENAAVRSFADPAPLGVEPVIAVLPRGTHVAERLPRDTDIAVPDGEYLPGRHFAQAVDDAHPPSKVFAIEKFGSGISAA